VTRSAAHEDIGYRPVLHHTEPGDRSPAQAALREMRKVLDHDRKMITDGRRPADDPFAQRQVREAYERLKAAANVYNVFARDLGVAGVRVYVGGVELTLDVPAGEGDA
jgi:hypothetical protein